jgi:putative transposase
MGTGRWGQTPTRCQMGTVRWGLSDGDRPLDPPGRCKQSGYRPAPDRIPSSCGSLTVEPAVNRKVYYGLRLAYPSLMARVPRNCQILNNDLVHTTWRGHNREWIFRSEQDKEKYLQLLADKCTDSPFELHAYCLMNNHNHDLGRTPNVKTYSSLMQDVHSAYAQYYNRKSNREGAVGTGRPKSTVVQDEHHAMNAMFYLDANPVRARIVKHPRHYKWCSHSYYATGGGSAFVSTLSEPEWYQCLGRTPTDRQRTYRRLFDAYLRREGMLPKPGLAPGMYWGNPIWIAERRLVLSKLAHTPAVEQSEPTDTS